ncbi:hypothetical protein CLV63_112107 [Murinocardiopsis flavida]|uniref:Uncharacterized protein n=2 Tax=Murinocardiopsis flavida TaxID=645275 RepID=A0A2P8DG77_9ACTN|nr:hypothetical protein CLV63_112107 [Murinocardiopsis flavida]
MRVLLCDEPGCGAELAAPASRMAEKAHAAGWQHRLLLGAWAGEDDGWEERTDRCPDHPAVPYEAGRWRVRGAAAEQAVLEQGLRALRDAWPDAAALSVIEPGTQPPGDAWWRTEVEVGTRARAEDAARILTEAGVAGVSASPVRQASSPR